VGLRDIVRKAKQDLRGSMERFELLDGSRYY
jgi:hypothetical protein